MAEIVEVITKLDYQANVDVLQAVNKEFEKEIKQINDLDAKIKAYEKTLSQLGENEIKQREIINGFIAKNKQALDGVTASMAKQFSENTKLQSSLKGAATTAGMLVNKQGQLAQSSDKAGFALLNLGRVAQDAPFGFLGISNNINPLLESFQRLQKETGSTKNSLKALGSSLIGAQGIGLAISIITGLLVVFGDELFKSTKETKALETAQKDLESQLINTGNAARSQISEEVDNFSLLRSVANNANIPLDQRLVAIGKIRKEYPAYLKGYTDEELINGKLKDVIVEINEAIRNRALSTQYAKDAQAAYNVINKETVDDNGKVTKSLLRQLDAEKERLGVLKSNADALKEQSRLVSGKGQESVVNSANRASKAYETQKTKVDELEKGIRDLTATYKANTNLAQKTAALAAPLLFTEEDKRVREKRVREKKSNPLKDAIADDDLLQLLLQLERETNEKYKALYEADQAAGIDISQEERKLREDNYSEVNAELEIRRRIRLNQIKQGFAEDRGELDALITEATELQKKFEQAQNVIPTLSSLDGIQNTNTGKTELNRVKPFDFDKDKKRILEQIDAYGRLFSAISNIIAAVNQLAQSQEEQAQRGIDAQSRRVEQAKEIAKRGNTEQLRLEQERLDELQKKREAAAEKQIQLNALIGISNSALALTEAIKGVLQASDKSNIITYIASIAAGFAAVAGLYASVKSLSNTGFAEGGYTGDGGKYQPKGVVHAGEFVFNKETTSKYRPMFEAIHTGKPLEAKYYQGQGYASKLELKGVESKLDMLIEVAGAERVTNDIDINESGIHAITTRQQSKLRNKWR